MLLGLLYALIWEGVVGGYVPGAKSLSIRQWGLSISESMLGTPAKGLRVDSPVGVGAAVVAVRRGGATDTSAGIAGAVRQSVTAWRARRRGPAPAATMAGWSGRRLPGRKRSPPCPLGG